MWPRDVPRVRPNSAPRAYWLQCGAPSPTNAGTKTTPPESDTVAASASTSALVVIACRPSRSHCTTAPPTNTEPSRQKVVLPAFCQPTLVSNLFVDGTGSGPTFSSMKQPVP